MRRLEGGGRQFIRSLAVEAAGFAFAGHSAFDEGSAGAQEPTLLSGHFDPKGQTPSIFTVDGLEQPRATLPFADRRAFEEQKRGFINFMGIRRDSRKAEGMRFTINLITPDHGEKLLIELENATFTKIKGFLADKPALTLTINRSDLEQTMRGAKTLEAQIADGTAKAAGNTAILKQLGSTLSWPFTDANPITVQFVGNRSAWDITPQISLHFLGGVALGGEVRLDDRSGHRINEQDYDPAPYVGLRFVGGF
jgi:hypothetical protein